MRWYCTTKFTLKFCHTSPLEIAKQGEMPSWQFVALLQYLVSGASTMWGNSEFDWLSGWQCSNQMLQECYKSIHNLGNSISPFI